MMSQCSRRAPRHVSASSKKSVSQMKLMNSLPDIAWDCVATVYVATLSLGQGHVTRRNGGGWG